jgi:hypothetical protein
MRLHIITEGYGKVYNFPYEKFKTDPKPRLLLLGKWRNPDTRNILLAGLNLHYLDEDQILRLREALPQILQPRNLKSRYWRGRELLPDIFEGPDQAYRTYDKDYVGAVTRDTLKFYKTPEELEAAEAPPEVPEVKPEVKPKVPKVPKVPKPAVGIKPEKPEKPTLALKKKPEEPEAVEPEARPEEVPEKKPEALKKEPKRPEEEEEIAVAEPGAEDLGVEIPKPTPKPAEPHAEAEVEVPETPEPIKPAPKKPRKKGGLTSAQRRKQGDDMKKAAKQQKLVQPPPKPEPPSEIRGAMGMFKKKK